MNDLQRSAKSRVELQTPSSKSRLSSAQASRKFAIGALAVLIVAVMIAWFGFLGWGLVAMLQWLLDCIKTFWTTYL
jgi:hypothetical protein